MKGTPDRVAPRQSIASDQTLYGFDVTDQDRALAEVDQALPMPDLEVLVDAFPATAGHIAELSLGHVKFDRGATMDTVKPDTFGEVYQRFGDPRF